MLYIKLLLCCLIIIFCFSIAIKKSSNIKYDAEKIRDIAQCLLLFKEGIIQQRKSVPDMLGEVQSEVIEVKNFFDETLKLIKSEPEKTLSSIFINASKNLKLSPKYLSELNTELNYVASSIERSYEDISVNQIESCCARILKIYDRYMDKYKEKLSLNKRIGIVLGIAISLMII